MPAVGLLYRVDRQGANRIDAQRVQLLAGYQRLFGGYHGARSPLGDNMAFIGVIPQLALLEFRG